MCLKDCKLLTLKRKGILTQRLTFLKIVVLSIKYVKLEAIT